MSLNHKPDRRCLCLSGVALPVHRPSHCWPRNARRLRLTARPCFIHEDSPGEVTSACPTRVTTRRVCGTESGSQRTLPGPGPLTPRRAWHRLAQGHQAAAGGKRPGGGSVGCGCGACPMEHSSSRPKDWPRGGGSRCLGCRADGVASPWVEGSGYCQAEWARVSSELPQQVPRHTSSHLCVGPRLPVPCPTLPRPLLIVPVC